MNWLNYEIKEEKVKQNYCDNNDEIPFIIFNFLHHSLIPFFVFSYDKLNQKKRLILFCFFNGKIKKSNIILYTTFCIVLLGFSVQNVNLKMVFAKKKLKIPACFSNLQYFLDNKEGNMAIQTHIQVQYTDISIMQMDIPAPFPLEQLMKISADDDNGNDLTRYLNIESNRVNYSVAGQYVVPVFLQANHQIINEVDVAVNVLPPAEANNVLPRIEKDTNDVYVEQTSQPHPYRIADFIKIKATDRNNQDVTRNLVLNMSQVDYSQAGDYIVIIKAPDDQGNIAISTFHLHVLTEEQVNEMENGDYDNEDYDEPNETQDNRLPQSNYAPPVPARQQQQTRARKRPKPKARNDDDDDDEHATYWVLIKKYWWVYIILGLVWFTCWDMFG